MMPENKKTTFALYFGNRGFFPGSLIASAREEMKRAVREAGCETLLMEESATRYGAVETVEEGRKYAAFLAANRGKYDGVILSLPNFGDENGAVAALRDCGVPILIQAYPDEPDKMDFESRRDAFCGKFSIMDVFYQYRIPFTIFKPHVIHPSDPGFAKQLRDFAALCRVVPKMKRLTIGAFGARTTLFKTVRCDELTLQKYGVTTETLDLSELFARVRAFQDAERLENKKRALRAYSDFGGVAPERLDTLAKTSLVMDDLIREYALDAVALRCWNEFQTELKIAPCVLLGELNDRGVPAACEMDVGNALVMSALSAASGGASACLDWNNNYGDDPDKCILFHCGSIPQSLMAEKGRVNEHKMFAKSYGSGCGAGANEGRIAKMPMTFASARTEDGKIYTYTGKGEFTGDPIRQGFFGCGGVAKIPGLQDVLYTVGRSGFRHHVSITRSDVYDVLNEAFTHYLDYENRAF